VRAYGDAVKAVLAELPRTEKVAQTRLALLAPYALYEPVRLLAEAHGAIIEEQSFGVDVTMELAVAIDHVDALLEALREASADQVAVMRHDEVE
jgi:putative IMPACT (imprinted ancient) family translation regulator